MRGWLVALVSAVAAATAPRNISLAVLEITTSVAKDARSVYVAPSLFGPRLQAAVAATSYHALVLGAPALGCTPLTNNVSNAAVLLDRGGCAFDVKVWHAQVAGAAMVLVRDTPAAALTHPGQIDCALGMGDYCEDSASCVSSTCVYSPAHNSRCCVENVLVAMNGANESRPITIPSVYLTVLDGALVQGYLEVHVGDTFVTASIPTAESPWNASMLLIWALGVAVVVFAAYHSAARERYWSQHVVATAMEVTSLVSPSSPAAAYYTNGRPDELDTPDSDDQPLQLTTKHAGLFLIMGSSMLLVMYYVHILVLIQLIFAVASAFCVAYLVTYPLAMRCAGDRPLVACILGVAPAVALVVVWFVENSHPWIWLLQDALGICLCVVFVDSIQLPSLQIATYLLAAAFFYDVFFVYLSPFVFGSNVMVDVASRAGQVAEINDFCTRHPESVSCGHPTVPLVLSLPLVHSIYGGSSLLGLGDIVLPALLVSFGLRVDYCSGRPLHLRHSYYVQLCVAYAAGLLAANVMSIVLQPYVAGQPALMYIVPAMLATVTVKAKADGDWEVLWDGPAFSPM
ncbi:signal peptide peptidase-like, aspartyl protease family A22B [Achlya hypogyna]|uniref:Signal peptide peptidase-like, aspartyl protease family A22B n=1 Tax=Achlya hypogyna TaxID=1202772 RepID=A0A1V9YJE4_ACHHY|nr:signal peptide peptidase-like, aspartyl protease family A22B [Achlya hypogyna]